MVASCFLLAVAVTTGNGGALPLAHYVRAVHQERIILDRVARRPTGAGIATARTRLTALAAVRTPAGTVHTDLPQIARGLRPGDPSRVRRASARLDALDDAMHRVVVAPVPPSELRQLDAVLRDGRFHPAQPPWAPLTDWIAGVRRRLTDWLAQRAGGSPVPTALFAVILLGAVAGFAYLLARGALARMVVDVAAPDQDETPATAASAAEREQAAARAGNYREATRYVFMATLLGLQEAGAIELRPGATNREYVSALHHSTSAGTPLLPALSELVNIFERVWYGHAPATRSEYLRAHEAAEQVRRSVAGRAA